MSNIGFKMHLNLFIFLLYLKLTPISPILFCPSFVFSFIPRYFDSFGSFVYRILLCGHSLDKIARDLIGSLSVGYHE